MSLSICVIVGTTRAECQSLKVARVVMNVLAEMDDVASELIEPQQLELPVLQYRLSEMDDPPQQLQQLNDSLKRADGVVIVAPEYKNGIPGSLKNALDYLPPGVLTHRPTAIVPVSSGGFGGVNCLAQLRLVCLAMGGLPIPDVVPVSYVNTCFDYTGALTNPDLRGKLIELLTKLRWYTQALIHQRNTTEKP